MIYKHFKGGRYEIVCEAIREEDMTEIIVYKSLAHGQIWTRPKKDFFGIKTLENGECVPRFKKEAHVEDLGNEVG